jgi:hypothetical protein
VPEMKPVAPLKEDEPSREASQGKAEMRLVSPGQLTLLLLLAAVLLGLQWSRRRI